MTKIVINKCYGGFGISKKALLKLIKMKSDAVDIEPLEKYFGKGNIPDLKTHKNSWSSDLTYGFENGFYYEKSMDYILFDDKFVYYLKDNYKYDKIREHSDLVKVVEELGNEANGPHANLEIVEIPFDVAEYEIDNYDGMESIHEAHRSW